jgi:hypothetical protein
MKIVDWRFSATPPLRDGWARTVAVEYTVDDLVDIRGAARSVVV